MHDLAPPQLRAMEAGEGGVVAIKRLQSITKLHRCLSTIWE
jgi:hypothetical protein